MKDTKKDLQQEIKNFENEIMKLDEEIKNIGLKMEPLHQELELISKIVIKKYSFRNIISFGLFNFFKKKKINQKIKKINQEIGNLMGQISDFANEKSQIKTKIIENYKTMINMMSDQEIENNIAIKKCFENAIITLEKQMEAQDLKIEPLHQELELTLNKKIAIKKYSFKNIISFGLFNFFKKKKINQEINILKGQINHFDDKKSQIKTKIIGNYKTVFKEMRDMSVKTDTFAKIIKDVSVKIDNFNKKQRHNSI